MRALSTLCKSLLICFTSSTVKSKHFFDETSENPTQDCPSYLLKRKADPIQAVTTKAAMLDAGVAWLMGMLVSLFALQTKPS